MLDNMLTWCTFDDYNWDLSLERLRATRNMQPYLLSMRWSRLLHYGICGSTHESRSKKGRKKPCEEDEREIVAKLDEELNPGILAAYRSLRPEQARARERERAARLAAKQARAQTHAASDDARDVFLYRDDDDGQDEEINVALASKLWVADDLKPAKARKHAGWGGFGLLDQNFCIALAGIEPRLLPPIDFKPPDKVGSRAARTRKANASIAL